MKSLTPRDGSAIWVEDVTASGFTVCVVEYAEGSNGTTEVNWMAFQSAPSGSQLETTSLDAWTSGTTCKKIAFKQVSYYSDRAFHLALVILHKHGKDAKKVISYI